jgi:hypothetical protein
MSALHASRNGRCTTMSNSVLYMVIDRLEEAGLVSFHKGKIRATSRVADIQSALNLSLTDLSEFHTGSLLLRPTFGSPEPTGALPEVFVLMPFTGLLEPVYQDHIRKAARLAQLTTARADDFFTSEAIIADIWRAIYNAKIVIADCTGRNPNVFYEIGIAHTVGRPTVLISQSVQDIPFDLRHWRFLIYEYTPRGMAKFTTALRKTLEVEKAKIRTTT